MGDWRDASIISVPATSPSCTSVTRTGVRLSSRRRIAVNWAIPAFVAPYVESVGYAVMPDIEAMFVMRPRRRASIPGNTWRDSSAGATQLSAKLSRMSSAD